MMWVNDWTETQFDAELDAAWKLWHERSTQRGKLDIERIFFPDSVATFKTRVTYTGY